MSRDPNLPPKTNLSPEEANALLRKQAQTVQNKDLNTVIQKAEDIKKQFESPGPLGRFIEDFKLLIAIVRDYWNGVYREIPYWSVTAIVATLLYVLNPLDLIPDAIPFIGQLDDAAVVAACLAMIETDLQKYKQWRLENPPAEE